ncbi:hypothetical protein RhiirA5_424842 [Rhizophagus irregularis]|uniref:Uncharacterized protein n=1 Tax=Rhizophagus irregularis TaxID=588596 RepID=A0A2N0P786_9GLOM|nr:hypothetical protein RhiirA5_424842 [Rhizophagus irregularis]
MKLLFIFLLSIILLLILPVKSSISFQEPQPAIPSTPRVLGTDCFDDGTIVLRTVRLNYTAPPKLCVEENLTIRTIYPNGTVKGFDLSANTLDIQPLNFCLLAKASPIRFYPIRKNLLLITYTIAEDENNPYTYNDWGMTIDLDGIIKNKTRLSPSYVNSTTNEWIPGRESIILNVHRENGFIRGLPVTGTNSLVLQQFKVNENGEIQSLAKTYLNYTAIPTEIVATMDGGYAVIYPDYSPATTIPLTPLMSIRGFFLQNGNPEKQGPFVLYQTSTPVSKIILLDCDFTKVGYGQTCILVLNLAPAIGQTVAQNTFIKIDFLSTGTVYNITIFQNPADLTNFAIMSLDYGGYFLFSIAPNPNNIALNNLYGYVLDEQSKRYDWNISYPTQTNFAGDVLILPNNTLIIPQVETGQTWRLLTTDLYKIEGARDHGYGNLHISSTIPNINDIIDPSNIGTLTIKFYNRVNLSPYRNVTILQDGGIVRQTTSVSDDNGDFVKLIDDYTIEIKVIDSTFNQPNTKYYILMDDGFVESKDLKEPIIGIQDDSWRFITAQEDVTQNSGLSNYYKKKVNASSIDGKVRLTPEGTTDFKSFKHDRIKVKEFFDNLTHELAKAVPVGQERITTNYRHEIDTSASPEQYILSINIKKAKNKDDKNVNSIASDLDTLIRNKLITVIGSGEYSNYLDKDYGYEPIPRWIEENLKSLLGTIALNIVLLLIAYWKKTFAIYTCGNAIEKFVTTILFTSIDADSVENIFTASLFFVTFPFIVNLGFAFKIVLHELLRHDLGKLVESVKKHKDDVLNSIERNKSKKINDTKNIASDTEDNSNKDNDTIEAEPKKVNVTKHPHSIRELIKRAIKGDEEKVKKLTKIIRETRSELIKIEEELAEVSELSKNLQEVNKTLKDSEKYTANKENLVKINDHIKDLTQVEDFTEELVDVSRHLNELEKLLKELKEINDTELKEVIVSEKESKVDNVEDLKVNEEIVREFKKELDRLDDLMKGFKQVEELKKQLNKAVGFMNGLKKEDQSQKDLIQKDKDSIQKDKDSIQKGLLIIQLEKLNSFKKEIEKTSIQELEKEREELEKKREELEKELEKEREEFDDNKEVKEGENRNSIFDHVKTWGGKVININIEETLEKVIEKDQQPKKYRKFSKWLRDYKDNQTIIVLFTILAGVDISHLELLGSKLRIGIPGLNYCGLETRNVDINFNAKLSPAAENGLFWGDVINIFIEDLSAIFIQCFYLSQVVSFGYTPIYTIAKSVIHLGTNSHHIYQYKRNHSTNPCNPNNSAAEE